MTWTLLWAPTFIYTVYITTHKPFFPTQESVNIKADGSSKGIFS